MKDFVPSLREVVREAGLEWKKLSVALPIDEEDKPQIVRHEVHLFDGKSAGVWRAPSLREIFRGDKRPPADMDRYPEEYTPVFYLIENHLVTACDIFGAYTDDEFVRSYSALRRRPDGKSMGVVHDVAWQASALALGMWPLSMEEFEAIIGRLERSARTWRIGPASYNYITFTSESFRGLRS